MVSSNNGPWSGGVCSCCPDDGSLAAPSSAPIGCLRVAVGESPTGSSPEAADEGHPVNEAGRILCLGVSWIGAASSASSERLPARVAPGGYAARAEDPTDALLLLSEPGRRFGRREKASPEDGSLGRRRLATAASRCSAVTANSRARKASISEEPKASPPELGLGSGTDRSDRSRSLSSRKRALTGLVGGRSVLQLQQHGTVHLLGGGGGPLPQRKRRGVGPREARRRGSLVSWGRLSHGRGRWSERRCRRGSPTLGPCAPDGGWRGGQGREAR